MFAAFCVAMRILTDFSVNKSLKFTWRTIVFIFSIVKQVEGKIQKGYGDLKDNHT